MSPNRRVKAVLTREVADQAIEILNSSNANASPKFKFWVQQTFSLTHTGKAKHLLLKKSNKPVCVRENMYDVIGSIHENLQHAGYAKTFDELKKRYSYIPRKLVAAFVNACSFCTSRRTVSTPVSVTPTIANKFMSRVQLDLIDLRTRPNGEYRYIVHARDHFTRFSWAEALTDNQAINVARFLFKTFTQFGPPVFLQSNNKKEFVATIIHELQQLWPGIHIINGDARDPRSQGLMTRGNEILKNKLSIWRASNKRQDWHIGLPLVVWTMNTLVCSATKNSPYYLVFRQHPRRNFALFSLLYDAKIINEEDLPDGILAEDRESEGINDNEQDADCRDNDRGR